MTAVVSVIMMGIGFIHGMIVSTLLDKCEVARLNGLLGRALEAKFSVEKKLDDVKGHLKDERIEKQNIVSRLHHIVRLFTDLPPPEGPLERSECYCVSESDSEDD